MSYFSLTTKVPTVPNNDREGGKKRMRGSFNEIAPNISNTSFMQTDVAQIRHHINIYRQLFIENKINRDNAWDIKIIDDVNYFVTNSLIDSETMLVAAMALDICVKVYAFKVEYIENEITNLMSNIQSHTQRRIAAVPEKIKNLAYKSKANKKKRRIKMYVAKDQKSILLEKIPKVAPIHFIENLDLYASNFENMSTINTPVNHSMYKFELLNDTDCGFISYNDPDPTIQTKLLAPMNVSIKPIVICREFHTFNFDEEGEDYNRPLVDPLNDHPQAIGVNYNRSQDTVPNLEEHMHSSFPDDPNAEENDETIKSHCSSGKKIEIITSLSPTDAFVENLMSPNPLLDINWIGPNHWKNKLVRLSDKTNIPYARRAKRVNMRKLKTIVLSCIIEDDNANIIHNDSIKEKPVKPIKFTDVHRKLLQKLPLQMKNEISIPVVFLALLHLANEHNLIISGCSSLNDVTIENH